MKKIVLLLFFIVIIVFAYYHDTVKQHPGIGLRIAYANIQAGNTQPLAVARTFRETGADVVLVEEWTGNNLDPIELLSAGYKVVLDSPAKGTHGMLLLAKKELGITALMVDNPIPSPCNMPILTSSFQFRKSIITIVGVHAPPPVKGCKNTTDKTVSYFAGLVSEGKLANNFGVGKKGDAVVLIGDLNSLPFNSTIAGIRDAGLADAQESAGRFLGATWAPFPFLPKLARIDYVLASPELHSINLWNTRMPGSDHSLLVADFEIGN